MFESIASTVSERVLYQESLHPTQPLRMQRVLPMLSAMTAGIVAAILASQNLPMGIRRPLIAAFVLGNLLVVGVMIRFSPSRVQRVEVRNDELIWVFAPRKCKRISHSDILSVNEEAGEEGAIVAIEYYDAVASRKRTLRIPSSSPTELVASIEWARTGENK